MADLTSISYGVCLTVIVLFGIFALYLSRRQAVKMKNTTEFFLTARHSVPEFVIAGSFYASAMGAWVVFSMPSYVVSAGIVGLVFYAISCGFPLLMIAYIGAIIQNRYPHILSLGDFVRWRFGRVVQIYVAALMVFNMAIGLAAEYTAIGNLFEYVLGGSRIPVVVTVAVVTSIYTAAGGLYVSIITDVGQAILSALLLLIVYIYVAATFRPATLPTPLNDEIGANYWGYSSIAAMPISLATSTVFSEGYWQRVWASADERSLLRGALWASIGVTIVCFLFGFGGFLSIWANYPASSPDGSTAFFDLLTAGQAFAPVWVLVLVAVVTVSMNEGTVDSYQNAITDTLSAVFFRNRPIWVPRIIVFLINIPLVFVSLYGYNINSLFLIGNVLCTISTIPVLSGLWKRAEGYISSGACLFGCLVGFWFVVIFGYLKTGDLNDGLQYTFFLYYDWPTFIIGLFSPAVGIAIWVAAEGTVRKLFKLQWPIEIPQMEGSEEDTTEKQNIEESHNTEDLRNNETKSGTEKDITDEKTKATA